MEIYFEKAGYNVKSNTEGMGEYQGVQQMIVDHAKETIQWRGKV